MQTSSLGKRVLQRGPSRVVLCRPPHGCIPSTTLKPRKAAVVVCAAPSKQESDSKANSSMPRLPPRKKPQQPTSPTPSADQATQSSKTSSSNNRSRPKRLGSFAGGPNQPPPSESPQSVMQEKALAGLLAYTGLMGTVATVVAFFMPGIDLFGGFHWDAADVSLALKLMLPVYGLNLLIMLPNYSSWKLPEVTAESQAAMVEAIAKWSARKGSKGSSGGSAGADASAAAREQAAAAAGVAAAAGEAPAAEAAAASQAAAEPTNHLPAEQTTDVASSAPAAAGDAALASSSSSSSSVATAEASTAASTATPGSSSSKAEDSWFSKQLKSPAVMRMRDALYMAQGHYLSINPAVVLPLPLQATVLLVDCLAAELLYRSVALQLAGGWIGDRMVEAGADDVLESLLAGLPVLPTHASGQLVAVALLSAAWGVVVLRNMQRMARRPQLMLGAQGRQAAGQLLTDLQEKHRRQQQQQQQQQQQHKDAGSSSSSTGASQPDSKAPSSPKDQQQQQDSASRAAADWAVAAAKAAAGAQQQQQQGGPTLEPQWSRRIPSTLSGLALSQLVQGARDIGQMTALGLSFVLTGNLAAPFTAAVVNQALMSALQKRGLERARQRSIAMAKHLAGITRQLRDAQRQQEEKKRQQQQHGEQQQPLAASADAVQDAKPAATAADGAPAASSTAAAEASEAAAPVLAAATTAAAGGDADPAAAAAAPDAAAPAGEALVASRMDRTISVLDQLLGQLGEHATAGPGPGK